MRRGDRVGTVRQEADVRISAAQYNMAATGHVGAFK